ncbi:MAG: trypsin-like peptidase domain-containing protein, partial [Pseudomonadota bacterium]
MRRDVPEDMNEVRLSFAPVAREAAPAVVNVYASRTVQARRRSPMMSDPFFRRFFGDDAPRQRGMPEQRMQSALGSGVIVSADGIVVTNNHVIEGADAVRVALSDRREYEAEILLRDPRTDLAVLRVEDTGAPLPFLSMGDPSGLEVGDIVLAIGNPFGIGQTVTSGIISALARSSVGISDFQSFIQTDAAINPGNSGGALVDMSGRLIGINTAIYSRSGGSNGIGFAIPTDLVRAVIEGAVDGGTLRRPYLGARFQAVTPDVAEAMGLTRPTGALVADVRDGMAAGNAGLRPGDIVVAVNEAEILDTGSLDYRLATLRIGEVARITFLRGDERFVTDVSLEAAPELPPRDERRLSGEHPFDGL